MANFDKIQIDHVQEMVEVIGEETIVIAMEESCEFAQQMSKMHRGKLNRESLAEEIADVLIAVKIGQHYSGITNDEIQAWIDFKTERTRNKIGLGEFK